MSKKNSFIVYFDWLDAMKGTKLSYEEMGILLEALATYARYETPLESENPKIDALYHAFSPKIKHDKEKYMEICKKNKENVEKRYKKD